jgi:ATP diphosphatase
MESNLMNDSYPIRIDPWQESWTIQTQASAVGFDWPDISGVFAKVREELGEIQDAWQTGDREHARRELGDLLFAVVNLARFLEADPLAELQGANERFRLRFGRLKDIVKSQGGVLENYSLAELDAIWEQVKKALGTPGAG